MYSYERETKVQVQIAKKKEKRKKAITNSTTNWRQKDNMATND